MAKTIKKAEESGPSYMLVEYNEFDGRYFLHKSEYDLQVYIQKLLLTRTILPKEIDQLLDLHRDVMHHERNMEECD